MSYDRWGMTPEMARRKRAYEVLSVILFGLVIAGILTCAALIVIIFGG